MTQRKYYSNYETFYEVCFLSGEHKDFSDEMPATHTATVYSDGYWCYLIAIDGQEANSLSYRNPKDAVRNGWIIKTK